jgi:hypothetical protein
MLKRFVNWFDEGLDQFYGDNNQGLIYGIYHYEDPTDFPTEVEWFRTEQERANA